MDPVDSSHAQIPQLQIRCQWGFIDKYWGLWHIV